MSGIQVAQGQERFVKSIGGYTENQSTNKVEYVTGQNVGGKKRAMDTVVYGTYPVSTGNVIAAGSTTRIIKKVAHGARENDIVQFTSGNNAGIAIQILSCPDADHMIIAATPEFTSSVGDTFDIKRYVSPQYDSNGSLSVTATMGPIQYNVDGVATEVNRDTTTPANTRPLPVEIMGANGTVINLTAGDINVQLSDLGVNFDRTRIGDGTNQLGVNASSEALVHDAGILAELMLKADLTDTQPVSIAGTVAVSGPLTDAQLRATAVPVSAGTNLNTSALSLEATQLLVKAKTDNLDVALSTVAKDATLLASNVLIGAVAEAAPATDTASSGLNGRLQRIAQNISAMILQLPATIGQKIMAASMSVTIASDQTAIPVSGTITANKSYIAGTLKTAQITVGLTEVRATTDAAAPSATRNKLMIKPSGDNLGAMFLIPTGGSITTGMKIIGPDRLEFLFDPTDYYLISDTAAQVVEILEVE